MFGVGMRDGDKYDGSLRSFVRASSRTRGGEADGFGSSRIGVRFVLYLWNDLSIFPLARQFRCDIT